MKLTQNDFVYCPVCGTQTKDGKKYRVKSQMQGMDILPHHGPYLTNAIVVDIDDAEIRFTPDREKVGWNGPAIRILFLCEDGHRWERIIANHGEEAISFAQAINDNREEEGELDRLVRDVEDDDDEDEEDS